MRGGFPGGERPFARVDFSLLLRQPLLLRRLAFGGNALLHFPFDLGIAGGFALRTLA